MSACTDCDDGTSRCVFPYYGLAPHSHAPGPWIGSTQMGPSSGWPDNFEPDPEAEGCGTYTHCLSCSATALPAQGEQHGTKPA